jgi:hypothetical protein
MQTVAVGVGLGIALGVCKIAYNIPLTYLLIPPLYTFTSTDIIINRGIHKFWVGQRGCYNRSHYSATCTGDGFGNWFQYSWRD